VFRCLRAYDEEEILLRVKSKPIQYAMVFVSLRRQILAGTWFHRGGDGACRQWLGRRLRPEIVPQHPPGNALDSEFWTLITRNPREPGGLLPIPDQF
jgi:hypothetical protein